MKKLAVVFSTAGFILNLPPIFIWATVLLRGANNPIGESMALWLAANFSIIAVFVMWLMFPSSALIFGLGGYVMEGKKIYNIAVITLSTILLLGLAISAAAGLDI